MSNSSPIRAHKLLVVDDQPEVLALFRHVFLGSGIEILNAPTGSTARDLIDSTQPDAIMLDVVLPDQDGLNVLQSLKHIDAQLPVVVMTAGRDSQTAIRAMQLGALDYLLKPLDVRSLNKVVRQALDVRRMMIETVELGGSDEPVVSSSSMIGSCESMQDVYKAIGRVAAQNLSVLIRGESGTGKELVARAILQNSARSDQPFLAINCAAIPESLLESELFGHEKGSFTGADRQRIGRIEQCHGGTLFLDEIGDMDATLQSKLLRVLQEKQFERVGGNEVLTADVRILAATHRDIERRCQEGKFREDLFYRLNGYSIVLPPLRERGDDLLQLIEHFRTIANLELGKNLKSIAPEALQMLQQFPWPGNVRQLQNVVFQSVLQSHGTVLLASFLPPLISAHTNPGDHSTETQARQLASPAPSPVLETKRETIEQLVNRHLEFGSPTMYDDVIEEVERALLAEMLDRCGGNQTEAAHRLGITRTTVRSKVNKLGIGIRRIVES